MIGQTISRYKIVEKLGEYEESTPLEHHAQVMARAPPGNFVNLRLCWLAAAAGGAMPYNYRPTYRPIPHTQRNR